MFFCIESVIYKNALCPKLCYNGSSTISDNDDDDDYSCFSLYRMATLTTDTMAVDEGGRGGQDGTLRGAAKRATNLSLPGLGNANTRSLFIFSEENFIRKYAKIIIEWGYPLLINTANERMILCTWCVCVVVYLVRICAWIGELLKSFCEHARNKTVSVQ